ncbi:MrcB family domain-containing protein [Plebeiibacterium marinum]|uniref:DUF3578 domain-containing protein n=1 Tax=Plebeiibacterium marinum TaxID=2992111 RepID=A0AAE3MH75_9BACT|nr:DUF3578 domain-containing protein [Plebeiobacterium marinum]MCW3807778.1 DUF3578 domain-containing protein [Plebeiobacterium marinum]
MNIPQNITQEDLINGAEKIINEGIPSKAHSSTYDVFYKNKLLPPKLIVSYANIYRNGNELERDKFEGGENTECFKLLHKYGFKIYRKDSVYPTLMMFFEQAKTGELKTSKYPKKIKGLECKISFGQGNQAKIPWISLLKHPNTTSKGIYPVYLFYKDINKLILAYGVSETNKPLDSWEIKNPKTISRYFEENEFGKPNRYGASFIYKVYNVDDLPDDKIIDNDLNKLVEFYLNNTEKTEIEKKVSGPFERQSFIDCLQNAGLLLNPKLVTRFISSLITKPFVILSGLSGSGKTKLAQAFVQWISQNESQYCIVPVGADWTNREPLLGYPNALKTDEYVKPDNGALNVIINANNHPELPHFLILDEMNLSHVERYFADFLSVMESKGEISLFAEGTVNNGVPAKLTLPSNLFIIGTVNIDETTYMFSPKVLDRANAIEFRVTKGEIENFFANQQTIDMEKLKTHGASMAQSFLNLAENKKFDEEDIAETHKTLVSFFEQLKKTGAEFGYRSATEIIRLINQLNVIDDKLSLEEKLDIAIMQKLLPKLHGSRRKLCPVLLTLGSFCVDDTIIKNIEKDIFKNEDFEFNIENGVRYPISLEKITRMYNGAIENGFASYAEA